MPKIKNQSTRTSFNKIINLSVIIGGKLTSNPRLWLVLGVITKYDSSYNQYNMNSDSDYDDVGVLPVDGRSKEATNNARKPSKKNCGGKTVRGGDR